MIDITIVIPVYNEEETLPFLCKRINDFLPALKEELELGSVNKGAPAVEILFVNDGSTDKTVMLLESMVRENNAYRYINLSRNFGHQAAVSAGVFYARGNAVVIIDGDLQDPPELIIDMLKKWKQGFDVVYAVKSKREAPLFTSILYKFYYKINSLISDFPIQMDSGDFSLLDRKIIDVINKLPEKEKYIRGLRAWVGFKQTEITYERKRRKKGKSKYPFISLAKLAFHGILSTSVKPLFLSGLFCALSIFIIISIIIFSVFSKIIMPENLMPKGWTSIMIVISLLSGLQLISIWLLSLYIAKIYRETLSRPTYLVAQDSLEESNR